MTNKINQRLQAELWEVQMLLYWILAFMLLHFSNTGAAHALGWACIVWSVVTAIGVIVKVARVTAEEKAEPKVQVTFGK